MRNKPPSDDTAQVERFKDLARELECDEDEAAFDEKLKRLAKAPKPPELGNDE